MADDPSEGAGPVNLERRVKRHVLAPIHPWFASCAPGLEPALAAEMREGGFEAVEVGPGGVSFRGRLEAGYRANLHLRIAGRIWLRVASYPARAPEDVYRQARDLPWEALLPPGIPVRLDASTVQSRLFGGGFLGRPLRDAIGRRMRGLGLPEPSWHGGGTGDSDGPGDGVGRVDGDDGPDAAPGDAPVQRLLARLEHNRLDLSLDSSGDLLHRRGHRHAHAGAPLRETLAAGILREAGYDGSSPLCDPMGGSGTFVVEAAAIARRLAPGRDRDFLFGRWPSARPAAIERLRRLAREASLAAAPCPITCRDVDPGALAIARVHAERAGVAGDVAFALADFLESGAPAGAPGLVVLNPPYGVRLSSGDDPIAFYRRVGHRLRSAWTDWRCAVIAPTPAAADALALPSPRRLRLLHGGLHVVVLLASL